MRFLADENFPTSAVLKLRSLGHDIERVGGVHAGTADEDIATWAARDSRVILTSDKDFGEIVYRTRFRLMSGVILFRLPMVRWSGEQIADIVCSRGDWLGHFSVVTADRIRMRPLIAS